MKKATLIVTVIILSITMFSCSGGNSKSNSDNNKDNSKQVNETKKQDLLTQQGFEKMLSEYGITLYSEMKFESIKKKGDDINITYNVPDLSEESHQKIKDYIANELLKLKNEGWGVEESCGLAMKKENNYNVGITISEGYAPEYKLHSIIYTYAKVY
jgi:hypothetical protein